MDYPGNPNPSYNNDFDQNFDSLEFELSDDLVLGDGFADDPRMEATAASSSTERVHHECAYASGAYHGTESHTNNMRYGNGLRKKRIERGSRVAFRTKSELEVMDDGYKWRKYGKKSVKNSPNPRNYYKCSFAGCQVKKRVERDREDSSYVITTYEGIHNHETPSASFTAVNDIDSHLRYYADHQQHQRFSLDLSTLRASNRSFSSSSS